MTHVFRKIFSIVFGLALFANLFSLSSSPARADAAVPPPPASPVSPQAETLPRTVTGDSRTSPSPWNEYYVSPTDLFQPQSGYRISFDYKVLARDDDANFYMLVRDAASQQRKFAWQDWSGEPGQTGKIEAIFVDRDAGKYTLVIGIHFKGEIVVSNLKIVEDPELKPLNLTLPAPARTWTSAGNTTYYVDSQNGSDLSDGRGAAHAWRTLAKVNSGTFGPGDKILLRSGSAWTGYLAPGGGGAPGAPLVIERYGSGAKPKIDARGLWLATLYLTNTSYVTVRNLDIANQGKFPQPKLTGADVSEINFGTAHQIVLDGLDIHDVTGSDTKDEGGGAGIDCSCSEGKVPTRFDGLLIENCHLTRTDRGGILMSGAWTRKEWYPSLHVVIRRNLLEDIGGDGIVPEACDGALVEYNVLRGGRMRAQDYAAGIWPWSCDNTVVQYNEVSGMKGTKDGEGFDSDWNCRNSLFQYNYSHDNDGGFMLICDDGSSPMPISVGNVGTVVRYNVSIDDGLQAFTISGPCSDASIYNNTIYLGRLSATHLVVGGDWSGWSTGIHFINNLFDATHKVGFNIGGMQDVTFQDNVFLGNFENRQVDAKALVSDPLLLKPGGNAPSDYRPRAGSPCLHAGETVAGNGGRDFAGNPVPEAAPPTVGAFQE